MKAFVTSAALAVALWICDAQAAIKLDLTRTNQPTTLSKRYLRARQNSGSTSVLNSYGSYAIKIAVGTPPQDLYLAIDTGSSDTWMVDSRNANCTKKELEYAQFNFGRCASLFNPGNSSTFNTELPFPSAFNMTYLDGSGAVGNYFTDSIAIGFVSIKNQTLGLAARSAGGYGILGLGYTVLVNPNRGHDANTYPVILDTMFDQGVINLKAFSLYLDSKDAKAGSIIFGGIDTDKYTGDLVQVAMAPRITPADRPIYDSLAIYLTSVSLVNGSQQAPLSEETMVEHVSLDSGSSLSHIPAAVAAKLYEALGAFDDSGVSGNGDVFVNCEHINSPATINFGFGDSENKAEIRVPLKEVVWTTKEFYGERRTVKGMSCLLGIKPSIQGAALLGDTFLRSAYVVYDLSNNVIALAQMNPDSTKETIVDFKETDTMLPGVKNVVSLMSVATTTTFYGGWKDIKSGTRVRKLTPMTTSGSRPEATGAGNNGGERPAVTSGAGATGTTSGAGTSSTSVATRSNIEHLMTGVVTLLAVAAISL